MKKFFFAWLFIPLVLFSQDKVVNASRVFPKPDKILEFEKAIAAHAQKYHTGDFKWRVWQIQSGPDASGYQYVEGPNTWEAVDGRGNLGAEHQNDWNKNVAIYLTDKTSSVYSIFREDLSTVALTDYSDKIADLHVYPKIGYIDMVESMIKKMKKTWEAGNQTIAVYQASSSGPAQFILVTHYKQGLKERNQNFRKPFKERYEAANGENSFEEYLESQREYIRDVWSELLFYRADLSSK